MLERVRVVRRDVLYASRVRTVCAVWLWGEIPGVCAARPPPPPRGWSPFRNNIPNPPNPPHPRHDK